jgi:hypothetical protein
MYSALPSEPQPNGGKKDMSIMMQHQTPPTPTGVKVMKNDCPTVCCVHDLVRQPCTNLEDCDEYIGSIIRSLLQEGKIIDSGRRRNGQILWVVPKNWQ